MCEYIHECPSEQIKIRLPDSENVNEIDIIQNKDFIYTENKIIQIVK